MKERKRTFKSLVIIHAAMLFSELLMLAILYYVRSADGFVNDPNELFFMVGAVISIATIFLSFFMYNKRKEANNKSDDLEAKQKTYSEACILRWGLLQGGNLIAVVLFFITGNLLLLPFFGFGWLLLLMARPTVDRFAEDFKLTNSERNKIV